MNFSYEFNQHFMLCLTKDKYKVVQNYASWKDLLEFDVLVYPHHFLPARLRRT